MINRSIYGQITAYYHRENGDYNCFQNEIAEFMYSKPIIYPITKGDLKYLFKR